MHTISLVVIARDEARCIARCLKSFEGSVDEMLVLDTGSSDGTPIIAKENGARVEHFAWTEDFSEARNTALAYSRGDWRVIVDADEWLLEGGDVIRMLSQTAPDFAGFVTVRNSFDGPNGVEIVDACLPRILTREVRYQGRVHEQPIYSQTPRQLAVVFGHDGYLNEQRLRKKDRNETLLRTALRGTPDDPYLLYQLGKELGARGDYSAAIICYQKACQHGSPDRGYWANLTVRLLGALQASQRWDDAVQLIESEMPRQCHRPDFMLATGNTMWNWAQAAPDRAMELLPLAEAAWLQCLELEDPSNDPECLSGIRSYYAPLSLAALYERQNDVGRATIYARMAKR